MGFQLPRHAPSSHRFNFAIVLTVIGILAFTLLTFLNKAQNDIEKVIVDTELTNLRLSLAEAWINKNIKNQSVDIQALNNSNPMLLITEKPNNYLGELSQKPSNSKEIWYFDSTKKQLVYLFNDRHEARFRLININGANKASALTFAGLGLVKVGNEVNVTKK